MNRFEAMLASPVLSGREMAMHVKMQKEVSRDEANSYRAEMLVPEVRLYDELTTLRFRDPGPDEENAAYRKACSALSGAAGTPIPYRFFKEEFDRLMDDIGVPEKAGDSMRSFKPDQITEAVLDLEDPWRTQAYAALCARIALGSETEDAEHAAAAWNMAFSLYDIFFRTAKAEESTTYMQQTEEKFKEDTVTAWNGFRLKLAEEIAGRVRDYIRDGRTASAAACIDALGTPAVRAVDSDAVDRALSESLILYVDALKSAKNLERAAGLYEKIPGQLLEKDSRQECARAMLSVMSGEVERLQADGDSVRILLQWINRLDVENLYRKGTPLVKKSAGDFYDECACYVRNVINNDRHGLAKYADNLAGMIPDDIVVATSGDGKELHRVDVIGLCTTAKIRSEYLDKFKTVSSESDAREMGRSVHQEIITCAMPGLPADREKELLCYLHQNLISSLRQSGKSKKLQLAFLECYDDSQPVMDETFRTVGGYKKMLRTGDFFVPYGRRLLIEFAAASDGTREQHDILRKIIDHALKNPKEEIRGEKYIRLAEKCCRDAFLGCLNKISSGTVSPEYDCMPTIVLAAGFLPSGCTFFFSNDEKKTMRQLERALKLHIDPDLRRRADKARKAAGYGGDSGSSRSRVKPGYHGRVIAATIKKVLPPFLFWLILTIINRAAGGLPGPARFFRMLFRIYMTFYIPIGFAEGCLKYNTPHPRLWEFVRIQACLFCVPFLFYKILEFFGRLSPVPVWGTALFVLYGIFYIVLTITSVAAKDWFSRPGKI